MTQPLQIGILIYPNVTQLDATTLVLPGWSGEVHPSGAILLTRDAHSAPPPVVATGGSVVAATPKAAKVLATWPARTDAWSIVLASIPKAQGRAPAKAIADEAVQRGLARVGILDSSRFASLHPGYWMVFTGVYETEPDANGALQHARAVVRTARVQRVSG